jgi:N-carbamoyl-L-amino-acid hydrolase
MTTNIRIDGERLWNSLMELAKIGATEKGGVCRLALTDLDRQARDLFRRWCEEAGCTVNVDKMGNMFARRSGRDNTLPPVMTAAYRQPADRRQIRRRLRHHGRARGAAHPQRLQLRDAASDRGRGLDERRGLALRARDGCLRRFAGVFDLDYGLSRTGHRRQEHGRGAGPHRLCRLRGVGGRPVAAFFEAHIEQGPILEAEKKTIGVVNGAQGQRWYEVVLTGQEAHAGPTPMRRRKDALVGRLGS